jgi:hypothetical protein
MKHLFIFCLMLCGCEATIIHKPDTFSRMVTVTPVANNTVLPVFEDKGKPDCLPTVEYKTVNKTQLVTPDMVYFCTTYDVKDQLKCIKWEKSYKALICLGKDCKTWTQGEATEPFGNVRD